MAKNDDNIFGFKTHYCLGDSVYHKHGGEEEVWFGTIVDIRYTVAGSIIEYLVEFGPNTLAWCSSLVLTQVPPNLL